MATISDLFSHVYTTENALASIGIKKGQIILCTDSEALYIDTDTKRTSVGYLVHVASYNTLPLAPLDKVYVADDTNIMYRYIDGRWQQLTQNDYTAFEVYANNTVIDPGTHPVLGNITVPIPAQMTETFGLRSNIEENNNDVVVDWGDGTVQVVKNGEHSGIIGPNAKGEYIIKMTHTYTTVGKYIVKVYGKDYFNLSHAPSVVSNASNMMCRCFAPDLPIAAHLINLTAFAYQTLKLTTVNVPSYSFLYRTINHAQMFTNDSNLLSATGFKDGIMISRGAEGCFQFCENMTECDFYPVVYSGNSRAMYAMYQNCKKMAFNIANFFPTRLSVRSLDVSKLFTHNQMMTGTVPADKLWEDVTIEWLGTTECFYGCPAEIRAQVPVAWGGTSTAPIPYRIKADTIIFNDHSANTAGGIPIIGENGKLNQDILPTSTIDLADYTGAVALTATGTNAIALAHGTNGNIGIQLTNGGIDIVATGGRTLSFNGAAPNAPGGLALVDEATGKLPSAVIPGGQSVITTSINQSEFTGIDSSYGGKYYELAGVCSVEVYDENGFEVGFDVARYIAGNKTRIYIPDSLAAGTISNWILLYQVLNIA